MTEVAVDKDGTEVIGDAPLERYGNDCWVSKGWNLIHLPKGSIEKLIGKELKWEDEPVKLK